MMNTINKILFLGITSLTITDSLHSACAVPAGERRNRLQARGEEVSTFIVTEKDHYVFHSHIGYKFSIALKQTLEKYRIAESHTDSDTKLRHYWKIQKMLDDECIKRGYKTRSEILNAEMLREDGGYPN